jgi:hypothetical protein
MQQLLIEVAEAKKQMEASLEIPQQLPRYMSDRGQVQVSAEWEPLAHILLSNNAFPFPVVVNAAVGDNSPYAMRGHTHQTGLSNAPAYVSLLEKLRKAQEEYSEHTAPELWKIKIRLLERMCKFDSDAALAVKREQEIERMEQETAAAERTAEEARQRAEAMREKMNSSRRTALGGGPCAPLSSPFHPPASHAASALGGRTSALLFYLSARVGGLLAPAHAYTYPRLAITAARVRKHRPL